MHLQTTLRRSLTEAPPVLDDLINPKISRPYLEHIGSNSFSAEANKNGNGAEL